MKIFLYVDNSNVWIEGMRVSAVEKGMVPNIWEAIKNKIYDSSWRIDFGKLYEYLVNENEIGCAKLYGSRPPQNDSLWNIARSKGFEPITKDRNISNREKKVDSTMVTDIMKDSYESIKIDDKVIIVSGDADFIPVVDHLLERRNNVEIYFWDHASNELKTSGAHFYSLNSHFNTLAF